MFSAKDSKGKFFLIPLMAMVMVFSVAFAGANPEANKRKTPVPTSTPQEATATPETPTETPVTPTAITETPIVTTEVPTSTPVTPTSTSVPSGDFIKGFDASYVTRVEDKGGVYKTSSGVEQDVFQILADNGVNYVRFRVWNNPSDGYCGKADVMEMSQRAKAAGLKILIDFHYSDSWADPSQQTKPAAWESMSFTELNQAVYDYTYDVISSLIAQGTPPDMVQIGNEITHGMLWTDGYVYKDNATYDTPTQWTNLATLVNSGVSAVSDAGSSAEIMIQIASGDIDEMTWFFDNLIAYGGNFDLVGISYYHNWHGSISDLESYMDELASRYGKEIVIAETSYPFTLDWYDWTNNIIGLESQLLGGYPASVEGQTAFLQAVVDVAKGNSLGRGVFYWGGEWIATAPKDTDGSTWENQALFNFQWKALNTFSVFQNTN